MKTLLERAKPELLAGLESEGLKYPNTIAEVKKWLSENYFCNQMTWRTWVDIKGAWYASTKELPDAPWLLFEEETK